MYTYLEVLPWGRCGWLCLFLVAITESLRLSDFRRTEVYWPCGSGGWEISQVAGPCESLSSLQFLVEIQGQVTPVEDLASSIPCSVNSKNLSVKTFHSFTCGAPPLGSMTSHQVPLSNTT